MSINKDQEEFTAENQIPVEETPELHPDNFKVKSPEMNLFDYMQLAGRTNKTFPGGVQLSQEQMEVLHGSMGMVTEAGELMDAIKKNFIYGAPLDKVNMQEELGDIAWYWILICRFYSWDPYEILKMNIDKLQLRFPNAFTEEDALNRDLNKERALLEENDQKTSDGYCAHPRTED